MKASPPDFSEEVLVNVLALDRAFTDFEFLHVYLGPPRYLRAAAKIAPSRAYGRLRELLGRLDSAGVPDEAPRCRRTYIRDFMTCVLAQVEAFILRKRRRLPETVSRLMAAPLPLPFSLEPRIAEVQRELRTMGFRTVAEFDRSKKLRKFRTRTELVDYALGFLDEASSRIARRCSGVFGFDLLAKLRACRVKVVVPRADEPSCFYRYEGGGRGILGLALRKEFSESYLQNFISHEGVPGHHLYYLVKQHRIDRGEGDAIDLVDTFYSPENVVNEGLAVCSDRLFGRLTDDAAHLSAQIEKLLHRAFYNAWHRVNVQRRALEARLLRLLRGELGFSEERLAAQLRYHTREARYYSPAYPLGIGLVEEIAGRLPPAQVPRLYAQHSAATLRRLAP